MKNMQTYEALLQSCLDRVPSHIYKGEGGFIYDALAPACFELAQMYIEVENIRNITYADTSSEDDLTKRCNERAVYRQPATKAIRKGVFNIEIPIGTRFSLEGINYVSAKPIQAYEYELLCEQAGVVGNMYFGTLIPIDYVEGLTTSELTDILVPGEEMESDEALRIRYFESLDDKRYGGNIADYISFTNSLNGVGGTKVYPVWAGGGTVKLVIIDTEQSKPSAKLIDDVQTAIDPIPNQGEGKGIAPIGHIATVVGVEETKVNISTTLSFQEGYTWEDVKPRLLSKLQEYFKEIRSTWDQADTIVVRTSHIETRALSVKGILDIQHTALNGVAQNIVIGSDNIPILGEVSLA